MTDSNSSSDFEIHKDIVNDEIDIWVSDSDGNIVTGTVAVSLE